jgi:hypothetical protein
VSHTSNHLQAATEVQIKEVDGEEGEFGGRGHRAEQEEGGVRIVLFLAMVHVCICLLFLSITKKSLFHLLSFLTLSLVG